MGVKSDFYFMTFFDPRPNKGFGRVLAFLALFGYLGYFWSELNGTLKFGTKWGVKSDFYIMTFFDWRPNKRAIDSFAPAALGQCNSLRARETYQNLSCSFNATSMPNQIKQKMCWDNFL